MTYYYLYFEGPARLGLGFPSEKEAIEAFFDAVFKSARGLKLHNKSGALVAVRHAGHGALFFENGCSSSQVYKAARNRIHPDRPI